ncbi:hypothetical protein E4U30_001975 [Claviceps sp. LM220 group G6]|nr:hypothetical protein E4U15_002905 [Claviceps sp. LM218 group G6]KAG6095868.1 hypothetical protein E4U30_001975 [Claviceps sp. LM220 group G6]
MPHVWDNEQASTLCQNEPWKTATGHAMTVELQASDRAMEWRQRSKPNGNRKLCAVSSFTTTSSQALARQKFTWSTRNSSQYQYRSMAVGFEDKKTRFRLRGAAADADAGLLEGRRKRASLGVEDEGKVTTSVGKECLSGRRR